MTTNAITNNAAALAASQNEASAAMRLREDQRKPPVAPLRESQQSGPPASRYAERQQLKAEGRGQNLDREA